MKWSVHYLNANGRLDGLVPRIAQAIEAVESRARRCVSPPALDIVVQPAPDAVIPEMGFGGNALRPGVIHLNIAPDSPMLVANLGEPFERTIAHELHHALRWNAVGYGNTLGEVLVSEGLAGRFVQELYGHDGEIWETAIPRESLPKYAEKAWAAAKRKNYNHANWFFGRGDLPRWLGYSLAWQFVGDFLMGNRDIQPSTLVGIPAEEFMPALIALAREQNP